MQPLKLVALDDQDLTVVSAHVQDAVTKVGDLAYDAARKRFVAPIRRFAWEVPSGLFRKPAERRASVLTFDRVLRTRTSGIRRARPEDALALMALRFLPDTPPAGTIELVFSGGATVRLEVECIEARLTDLGGAWGALAKPKHRI